MLALTLFSCETTPSIVEDELSATTPLKISKENLKDFEFLDVPMKDIPFRIEAFLDKVKEGTTMKNTGNTYNINELIWTVEATENYLHTNGLIEYPKLETSKTTFPLNYSSIQNGMPIFSEATAIQLFNDIDAYVQQEFNIATAINKDIAIVNLYPTLDQSDNIGIGVEVVIESSIGTGDDEDEQLDEGCNLFASWKTYPDGTGIGICGGGTSEFVKDAAERLQIVVNDRVGLNSCNPSICPGYYMNIVTLLTTPVSHPNPNDNIIGDGYREFLLFDSAENEPLYTDCLNPVEMNFYLNGAYQAIGNFMLQYTPFGLDYAFVNFVTVNQTNGINGFVHHNLYITLGTRVCYLDVEPVAN